jgi:hypothetical protein
MTLHCIMLYLGEFRSQPQDHVLCSLNAFVSKLHVSQ